MSNLKLDVRTRTKADMRTVNVTDFFERELPALIAERGAHAIGGAKELGLTSLTLVSDSGAWTIGRTDDTFTVTRGDTGLGAIRLSDIQLSRFISDITTFQLQIFIHKAEHLRGPRDEDEGWAVVLRSLLDNRPMTTAGSVQLRDREGHELDLSRKFTREDDDAEIAHFLCEAGFLHLTGWFDKDVMRQLSDDMDRGFEDPEKVGATWWVTLDDGSRRPVRIPHFETHSEAAKQLIESEAYHRIGRLTNEDFRHAIDVEAAIRPLGVVAGLSHLPWHADCNQGMHSYKCRNIVVGICVNAAGPGSAQLGVVPGSHRAMMPKNRVYPEMGLKPIFLDVQPGDVTVHTSCTLHTSVPPTDSVRKVVYTGFMLPCDEETEIALAANHQEREEIGDYAEDQIGKAESDALQFEPAR